jgi:hypothetical protein
MPILLPKTNYCFLNCTSTLKILDPTLKVVLKVWNVSL